MGSRYDIYRQGSCGWTSLKNEEFQEDDVWSVLRGRNSDLFTDRSIKSPSSSSSSSSGGIAPRRVPTAAKMIPRSSPPPSIPKIKVNQSAPVNIPDWSKIYGAKIPKNPSSKNSPSSWSDDDDDDDDGDDRMPPHEWVAKKNGGSERSSFSVCEGAGRTLKGRDLSRMRNAVLTKTGFLE